MCRDILADSGRMTNQANFFLQRSRLKGLLNERMIPGEATNGANRWTIVSGHKEHSQIGF